MITAALQDIFAGKVTNRLIATGLVTGLVFQVMEHGAWGIWFFLGNISVPIVLLYLLFQMRALGAGDIKLFSMIGSFLTIWELLRCMFYGFLAAGAGAVLFLAADKRRWQRLWYGVKFFRDFVRTGNVQPYCPPYKEEALSYAFSVPVLVGTIWALYL